MLDPTTKPVKPTDALVVFPTIPVITDGDQRKAKLLVGKDIETYFALQKKHGTKAVGTAYSYRMVWDRRNSACGSPTSTFEKMAGKAFTVGVAKETAMDFAED